MNIQPEVQRMNALSNLSDAELMDAANLTDADFEVLENQLAIRADCLVRAGHPMCQPLSAVAGIVRSIIRECGILT